MEQYAIIINGAAEVGKDSFVQFCSEPAQGLGFKVCNFSSVDKLKEELFTEEEPYDKSPEHRLRIVDAKGRIMKEDPEYFARGMGEQVKDAGANTVSFLHVREPEQIALTLGYFAEHLSSVQAQTLLIVRSDLFVPANTADTRVEEYTGYTDTIQNDAGLDDFAMEANDFIERLLASS